MNLRQLEAKVTDGKKLVQEEEEYLIEKINSCWDEHPDVTMRFPRWKKILAWVAGYHYYVYAMGS